MSSLPSLACSLDEFGIFFPNSGCRFAIKPRVPTLPFPMFQKAFDILAEHVQLHVDTIPHTKVLECRKFPGMRNDGYREVISSQRGNRQAYSIYCDRADRYEIPGESPRHLEPEHPAAFSLHDPRDGTCSVDVPQDEMPAEAIARQQRPLEIHRITNVQVPQVCLLKRFFHCLNSEGRLRGLNNGEANTIDRYAIINLETTHGLSRPKGKHHAAAATAKLMNGSFFFDETSKQSATSLRS